MNNITDIFDYILKQADSIDIAESEFKKLIHEDPEIKQMYRDWCHEVGSSEKNGFLDYCEEYMDSQNSIWDTLNDYDSDY
ncbi:MAG: hypothetical protein J1E84_08065 [Muribaculaceae bacterium]|nr:hypothetical protein [Muribaculaceae bacterium]